MENENKEFNKIVKAIKEKGIYKMSLHKSMSFDENIVINKLHQNDSIIKK